MSKDKILDAVIVGAGPAGVSCAIWLARLGFSPVLLEARDRVGGLCCEHPFSDGWNATLPEMTGPEVARNLGRSLELAQVDTRLSSPVSKIESATGSSLSGLVTADARPAVPEPSGSPVDSNVPSECDPSSVWRVSVHGESQPLLTRHLVLATGVSPRGLPDWPRDRALPPGILIGPGTDIVRQTFAGKRVAVLGGGDNAFENALYARQHGASEVRVFARTVRAQQQFVQQIPPEDVVRGTYQVNAQECRVNGQAWDLILVFYGWEARLPDLPSPGLQRCEKGFVSTEPESTETSLPGIYAIGEMALRMHPCVVTALADGVTAAKTIQARLESARAR